VFVSLRPVTISRLAGAIVALWLCGGGQARAGGSADAGTLQTSFLNPLCTALGMTSCPQLPTVTQIVVEYAALSNSPPDLVRSQAFADAFLCTVSGVPGLFGVPLPPCSALAVSATNPPAPSSVASSDLSSLVPLAFISPSSGLAIPVPLGTSGENSFFYAVLDSANGQQMLDLFFDFVPWTTKQFVSGQLVASIEFPMVVLNRDGSERSVAATLQLTPTCSGAAACLSASVTGDFVMAGTRLTYTAAQLGLQIGYSFGASPNSATPHGMFELQIPPVVTGPSNPTNCGTAINNGTPDPGDCGNDPAYFGVIPAGATLPNGNPNPNVGSPIFINQTSGLPTDFLENDLGFTPMFLGLPVGTAPSAAPLCPGSANTPCPSSPPATYFGFCASFSNSSASPPFSNRSAVAGFLAIGTDGTTYVSSPVPMAGVTLPQCPPQD
jgi:hypothetical protein